jgi:hypothetical protein
LKLAVRSFERGRETVALTAETLSDVLAEVQAELHAEAAVRATSGGDALLSELLANQQAAPSA